MTQQDYVRAPEPTEKLRDEIAKLGANAYFKVWDSLTEEERDNWRFWAGKVLLALQELPNEIKIT
uniref:Uncharacterized protein n=1 Tax=viral metagenome TaxID=1070528 RepID=A0A6H2A3X1_9ZZZZ